MAWEQVATIVVTVVLAVLAGVLYNNRRFDDVHRRIDDLRADMNARFAQVDARFAQVDARFAEVHARLGELREDLRLPRSSGTAVATATEAHSEPPSDGYLLLADQAAMAPPGRPARTWGASGGPLGPGSRSHLELAGS